MEAKSIDQIKNETAVEHGWKSNDHLIDAFRSGAISNFSFDDYMDDVAKLYAIQQCEKVRRDCADKIALLETENYNTLEFDNGYCLAITQSKEAILSTPITLT